MTIKHHLTANVSRGAVIIEIAGAEGDDLKAVNAYVELRLEDLRDEGIVKVYKNRIDFFVAIPQTDWQPVELLLEVRKRLAI